MQKVYKNVDISMVLWYNGLYKLEKRRKKLWFMTI